MDNQKRFKRLGKPRASLDGFVLDGRRLGKLAGQSYQPNREAPVPALGDPAVRAEGFHAMRQAGAALGESSEKPASILLDEPIMIEHKANTPKKKFLWHPHLKGQHILKRSALVLAALILLGGVYMGDKLYQTERHLFRGGGKAPGLAQNVDINQLKAEGDGRVNVLLLGIGGPGHDGPDLTDTIMLASIDPVNNKVTLLSIPRDLWVKIPGNGYQKINAAYPDGKMESSAKNLAGKEQDGLNLLDQTLEPVLGIQIHYHVVVDFRAFQQVVDALGGISVNVPEELDDPTIAWENGYNSVIAKPGVQTFSGAKALLYVKSRETSSDFARAERQRLVLVAIKNKVFSLGTFSNPVKVSQLLNSLGGNVFTDFGSGEVTRVYQIIKKVPSGDVTSLDLVTPPNALLTTADINDLSVVEPRAGLFDYSAIQTFVRSSLHDGFLVKENAPVAVYNATATAGVGSAQAAILKTYGYNVTTVDSTPSPTNPATTTLVDLSGGKDKYTRHYLEIRYKTIAVTALPQGLGISPPTGTGFVIILGKDVAASSQN